MKAIFTKLFPIPNESPPQSDDRAYGSFARRLARESKGERAPLGLSARSNDRAYNSAAASILSLTLLAITPVAIQAATQEAATPPPQPATEPISPGTPSRNVTPEDLKSHVESLLTVFSIRNRATDPFGQIQDPNARPIVKPTIAKTRRYTPVQATPFSDIVRLIKVTTVMPAERRFLIGNRSIKQGDRIPIAFRGKNLQVEVAAVNSRQIQFRNLENGETAALKLNMLPAGMSPGNDGITAPGMVPDNPNAPIDLDGNSLPLNAAQNR